MAKKNWIYIKRGLSEDPKHRAQMGECIWLFMHIIDRADWETGIAYDWKDREEAADMGMSFETLRDQRQKLEKLDYIRCIQKQRGQDIKIMEWRNPREYGTDVKNPRIQGDGEQSPSEFQGDAQGDGHGDPQGSSQAVTPTYDSISISKSGAALSAEDYEKAGKMVDYMLTNAKRTDLWPGRELFRDYHYQYADWWHELTGQPLKGNKKQVSSLQKACAQWHDQGLSLQALSAAYHARKAWKKFIADPNEITTEAAALQALPERTNDQAKPATPPQPVVTPLTKTLDTWVPYERPSFDAIKSRKKTV